MAERSPATPARHSVFVKLLAIMAVTTVSLLLLVVLFFAMIVSPKMISPTYHLFNDFAKQWASASPGPEAARDLARRLDLEVAYQGPAGAWATTDGPPRPGSYRVVVESEDGGRYSFAWAYPRRMSVVHDALATLLSVFIAAVILAAYLVLRRLLRPLRWLGDGVARLADGELDVVVPVATRDELGTLTDAFNRMVRRVGEMIRARDRLLLDISHELRSPLTRLKVALELLPDGPQKARMTADVDEMGAMVAELLELERLRDGPALRRQLQELGPILQEVAATFRDRRPGVVVDAPTALLVEVDADKIRTVLRNLIENATKYALPDSRVIAVVAREEAEIVVVRVDDDGPGIPEGDLPALFEPFFRVDRSRSKSTGGYGLGLSICKRILEAHGGSIVAENRPGRGASFTLTLPKAAPLPKPATLPQSGRTASA